MDTLSSLGMQIFLFLIYLSLFLIVGLSFLDYLAGKNEAMQRAVFKDPFNGQSGMFFVTSDHLETITLFRDENEFVFGVNSLAICLVGKPLILLCYCLMANHMHLVLKGRYSDCLSYYDRLIGRLSQWLSKNRGIRGLLKKGNVDIQAILDSRQLRNYVGYTLRNPYRARIDSPLGYRWSSADVYFNPWSESRLGEPLSALPVLLVRDLMGTKDRLPDHYTMHDGVILNYCFVDRAVVEKAFGDSILFFDTIRKYDLESIVKMASGIAETIRFSDVELMERIRSVCQNEYHVKDISGLDRKGLLLLSKTLARRFGAGKKQIARLTGLSMEDLDRFL